MKLKMSPSKVGPVQFLMSEACLLPASFPPGDTIAWQHNDWEFFSTQGFNCGKGHVGVEGERRERTEQSPPTRLWNRPFQNWN